VHTLELPKDDVSGDEKVGRTKALSSLSRQRSSECPPKRYILYLYASLFQNPIYEFRYQPWHRSEGI
jgi:hypothetical protein